MARASAPTSSLHAPVMSRSFAIMLGVSVAVHLGAFVGYAWWDSRRMDVVELPDQPIKATMVRLGKPRDPKLLPRIDTAPKPKPATKQVPVLTKNDDAKPVQKLNDKREEAEDEERMQSALDRIRDQVERDKAKNDALARIAERVGPADEEAEGAEDGDPRGDSATPAQVNAYFASLRMAVKARYVVPSVIQVHECARLEATVGVRMDPSGEVDSVEIMKRSGHELFDAAVIQAVKAASPLPPPPPNMRELVVKGFGFKFRCSD